MPLFGGSKPSAGKQETAGKPDGEKFLRTAKQELADVFSAYAEKEEEFNSVGEFLTALFEELWGAAEPLLKKNFYNGLRIGQASRRGKKK